ncbi:MAG: hypothetical protein L3J02_01590 [Henriciella sp.]|nr:hypothetical protein [Henriciella sp.]
MATRVLFQLVFFLLPFFMFGIYRIAIAEAQEEGRKKWPIWWLFGIGLFLAVGSWFVFIALDQRGGREECYQRSEIVDGVMVRGHTYACDKDFSTSGRPEDGDPGGRAEGVGMGDADDPVDTSPDE